MDEVNQCRCGPDPAQNCGSSADGAKTIMAIGAHHDDNELVAGTLATHRLAGWRVISVIMTAGQCIGTTASDENIKIREAESLAAAELLGMETVFMRLMTHEVIYDAQKSCLALVEQLRKYRPDVVITHYANDYQIDHNKTSAYTIEAAQQCWVPSIETKSPPYGGFKLYYADTWLKPFVPDTYIDITEYMDLKVRMLRCHKSQLPEATAPPTNDMIHVAKRINEIRGLEIDDGVNKHPRYAEAFQLVRSCSPNRASALL